MKKNWLTRLFHAILIVLFVLIEVVTFFPEIIFYSTRWIISKKEFGDPIMFILIDLINKDKCSE